MKNVLIIDTSIGATLVALVSAAGVDVSERKPAAGTNTSQNIIPHIDAVLSARGLTVADVPYVAVAVGPGSFTGLRIGVSVANAMMTAGKALLPVNLLDMLAYGEEEGTLVALPSRVGFCYTNQGEKSVTEVADAKSVGTEGTGARKVVDRTAYGQRLVRYVLEHLGDAEVQPAVPVYLKKSQAERLREGDNRD